MTRNRILSTAAAVVAVVLATATIGLAQTTPPAPAWGPGNCPMAQQGGPGWGPGMGMGRMKMGMMGGPMGGQFGPGGPATAASGIAPPPFAEKPLTTEYVTKFVESRLSFWNNPNLAIGQVQEQDGQIKATIVTKNDGKLFRQFTYDKQTGWPMTAQ